MSYPSGPQMPYGPPPQNPKQGMSTGAKIGVGCGGCLGVLLILFMFAGCMSVLSTPTDTSSDNTTSQEADADEGADEGEDEETDETHPGLGETVEHGDWEITVHSITYDVPTSDLDALLADDPSGQWVTVDIEATNTSSGPEYFEAGDQVLMDADGSMYSRDISATDGLSSMDRTNPGGTVEGTLAYDVPEGFEADHMLVNGEGMFDDGVRVDLG